MAPNFTNISKHLNKNFFIFKITKYKLFIFKTIKYKWNRNNNHKNLTKSIRTLTVFHNHYHHSSPSSFFLFFVLFSLITPNFISYLNCFPLYIKIFFYFLFFFICYKTGCYKSKKKLLVITFDKVLKKIIFKIKPIYFCIF